MRIGIFNDSIDNYTFEIIDNIEKIDESYDLILININDIDKIEYIQKNAKCEIVVIVENDFYHNLIENELISAIINKNDVDDLNDWLQYFEAKTNINKLFENEMTNYKGLVINSNGYIIEKYNEFATIKYEKLLTEHYKNKLFIELENYNYNLIIKIPETIMLASLHLGQIIKIWNFIRTKCGCMYIINEDERNKKLLEIASIDKFIKILNSIDDIKNLSTNKIFNDC